MLYNLYLYNLIKFDNSDLKIISQSPNKFNETTKCKSLVNFTNYEKHVLGSGYYPSKNEMNKNIINIKFESDQNNKVGMFSNINRQNRISLPELFIKTKRFYSTSRYKTFKLYSPIYNEISTYLINNPINEKTQMDLERLLSNYSYIDIEKRKNEKSKFSIDYSSINNDLTKILLDNKHKLLSLINHFKSDYEDYELETDKGKARQNLYKILSTVDPEYVINILLGRLFIIISSEQKHDKDLSTLASVSDDLGKDLIKNYYYEMYLLEKAKLNDSNNYSLSKWKAENNNIVKSLETEPLVNYLGSLLIDWLSACNLLTIKTLKKINEKNNILVPTKLLTDVMSKSIIYNLPSKLPMIVKPKLYIKTETEEKLGGYLLNDELSTDQIFIKNRFYKKQSEIKEKNIVYSLVNNISSVGYKINKDVLDFIMSEYRPYYENQLIYDDYIHPLLNKTKLTQKDRLTLDSFNSKKELQNNILGLAYMYSNVSEFFIPVRLDSRGRLYCIPDYFHYQSNELAKSLLLFSKPEKVYKNDYESLNYLKLYGANCYGNKLDKKSGQKRIDWIDQNLDSIINFKDGKLIKKAENKFLFTAFCFEYNRLLSCLGDHEVNYFETYLPIQLDATCNGYQHLSMLGLDSDLAKELNLCESNWDEEPKDFYSYITFKFIELCKNKLNSNNLSQEDREGYERLSVHNIHRKIIKKNIMTIPYNVSVSQGIKYLKEEFLDSDENGWLYLEGEDIKLRYSDFNLMSKTIREVLTLNFSKMNNLIRYLKLVAKVMNKLGLPIPWTLPSGVYVQQSYLDTDDVSLKPFSYSKHKFTLKIKKDNYDNKKQVRAFMPNLIHSLDAASLALLIDLYFNRTGFANIYTVHDCFAVTANQVHNTMNLLKQVYINIYSNETYLIKLDRGIKDTIKLQYGEECFDEKTLKIKANNLKLDFPNVNIVISKELDFDFNGLKSSKYIIN